MPSEHGERAAANAAAHVELTQTVERPPHVRMVGKALDRLFCLLDRCLGLVGQQGVDNAIEHLCHWVAEEDAASRKQLADAEGDSLDGILVFHTATGHLGCALQVAFIELFVGQFQICGQRALAAEGLLCIGSQVEGQQE